MLVNIDVGDREQGVRFYTSAFELTVGRDLGDAGVELLGAEAPIYILEKKAGTAPFDAASSLRDYARHWTAVHLDFVVEDLERALARAEAAGAVREGDISAFEWGRMVTLSDPFGNGVCLLQFNERGYDAIAVTG